MKRILSNISDLKTTIPTIIASVMTILVVTGTLSETVAGEWEQAILGLSVSILTIIGLISKK
jgi:hypothetical protein